jgi:hypothetical protein
LSSRRFFQFRADSVQLHDAPLQAVEEKVDYRGGEEGQHLRDDQSADDGDAQRLAQLRADAHADGQRKPAEQGSHGGHHDGAEAQQAGLIDGFDRRQALLALGLQGEVDHHDGVLFHDADQQNECRSWR